MNANNAIYDCCILSKSGRAHLFIHSDSSTPFAFGLSRGLNKSIGFNNEIKTAPSSSLSSSILQLLRGSWMECSYGSSNGRRGVPSFRPPSSSYHSARFFHFPHHSEGSLTSVSTCSLITQPSDEKGKGTSKRVRWPRIENIAHASIPMLAGNDIGSPASSWVKNASVGLTIAGALPVISLGSGRFKRFAKVRQEYVGFG